MKQTINFSAAALALLFGVTALPVLAGQSAEDFVDEASAKGIAEVESAKLALEESRSEDIRNYAQMMIDDHTAANQELKKLAQQKQLEVSDDATLMDQAKTMMLQLREGESFDEAYAANQVTAHEQTIELFREQVREGEDEELKSFAREKLPKLEEHLNKAQQLDAKYNEADDR